VSVLKHLEQRQGVGREQSELKVSIRLSVFGCMSGSVYLSISVCLSVVLLLSVCLGLSVSGCLSRSLCPCLYLSLALLKRGTYREHVAVRAHEALVLARPVLVSPDDARHGAAVARLALAPAGALVAPAVPRPRRAGVTGEMPTALLENCGFGSTGELPPRLLFFCLSHGISHHYSRPPPDPAPHALKSCGPKRDRGVPPGSA
jgi:hypothetical protein